MSMEFLLTSIVIILLPGTGVLYTLAIGLSRGLRSSIAAAFGCTLGIIPHMLASIVGLAAILHASALAFQVIKYLGVAYLIYMAWRVLRDDAVLSVSKEQAPASWLRISVDGVLLNVLNPKLSLFFLAFLPQFVPVTAQYPTAAMAGLAAVFMLLTFLIFIVYGACSAAARDFVISRPVVMTWLKRSFAGAFGILGLKLALSDR